MSAKIFEEDEDVGAFDPATFVRNGDGPTSARFKKLASANNIFYSRWGKQTAIVCPGTEDSTDDSFNSPGLAPYVTDYDDATAAKNIDSVQLVHLSVDGEYSLRFHRPLVSLGGTAWPAGSVGKWIAFRSGRAAGVAFKISSVTQDATNNYISTVALDSSYPKFLYPGTDPLANTTLSSSTQEFMLPNAGDTYQVMEESRAYPIVWRPTPGVKALRFIIGASRRFHWTGELVTKSTIDLDQDLGIAIESDTEAPGIYFRNTLIPNKFPIPMFQFFVEGATSTTTSLVVESAFPGIDQAYPGTLSESDVSVRYPYDDELNNCVLSIIVDEGVAATRGQTRRISDYDASTGTFTLASALAAAPGGSSTATVIAQVFSARQINAAQQNIVLDTGSEQISNSETNTQTVRPLRVSDSSSTGETITITVPFDIHINYILISEIDRTPEDSQ